MYFLSAKLHHLYLDGRPPARKHVSVWPVGSSSIWPIGLMGLGLKVDFVLSGGAIRICNVLVIRQGIPDPWLGNVSDLSFIGIFEFPAATLANVTISQKCKWVRRA